MLKSAIIGTTKWYIKCSINVMLIFECIVVAVFELCICTAVNPTKGCYDSDCDLLCLYIADMG